MMKNEYYNKTMNLNTLAKDLEKQGYICELEDGEYLSVYYTCYFDYVEIALTEFKDWSVDYYHPFKGLETYKAATNWSLIKLLRKLFNRCKREIAQHTAGLSLFLHRN